MKNCNGNKEICLYCDGKYCADKVSIFSILDKEELEIVTNRIMIEKYIKNECIFKEEDIADKLYLISKGRVKINKYSKDGKEQILYLLTEGDFVGDINLFKEDLHKFNALALEPTEICTLSKSEFDSILKSNPNITLKMLQILSTKVVSLETTIETLSTNDVESKLVNLLLNLINKFGTHNDNKIILDMPLSREDLANYIGTSRETVSRKLSTLQNQGVIRLLGNKKILIEDLASLHNMN